jgi:hypothetical protein
MQKLCWIAVVMFTVPAWLAGQALSFQPFSIAPDTGTTFAAGNAPGTFTTGFATVGPNPGSLTPDTFSILQFRNGGTLISETIMPSSSPTKEFERFFVEVDGNVNAGVAIANPNSEPATIFFGFQDPVIRRRLGLVGEGSFTIPANSQFAGFINQPPFNFPGPYVGLMTVGSSIPVGLTVVRGVINERSEFLMTSIVDGQPAPGTFVAPPVQPMVTAGFIPRFAVGGGWSTEIVLINDIADDFGAVTLEFVDPSGAPATVRIGDEVGSSFFFSIPLHDFIRIPVVAEGPETRAGYIRIIGNAHSAEFHGFAMFSFKQSGVTVSITSSPMVQAAPSYRLFVDQSNSSEILQTGIAISNPSSSSSFVFIELTDLQGNSTRTMSTIEIPPSGQFAMFVNDIPGFQAVPASFRGVLRIRSLTEDVTVIAMRGHVNQRGDFINASLVPVEVGDEDSATRVVPQIVQGGGYSSELVLVNAGPARSTGTVNSVSSDANALSLQATSPATTP